MTQCVKRGGGFSLIEVLVAIVIFSIGMLGLLGLTANGLLMTYTANYTTTAAELAYAMADRVRGNATQLASYNQPTATYTADCFSDDNSGCTKALVVQAEFKQWQDLVAAALPSGSGIVCRDSSPNDGEPGDWSCDDSAKTSPYVVKICWANRNGGGGRACYRVVI